jgi:hypothetical protein
MEKNINYNTKTIKKQNLYGFALILNYFSEGAWRSHFCSKNKRRISMDFINEISINVNQLVKILDDKT